LFFEKRGLKIHGGGLYENTKKKNSTNSEIRAAVNGGGTGEMLQPSPYSSYSRRRNAASSLKSVSSGEEEEGGGSGLHGKKTSLERRIEDKIITCFV